MPIVVKDKWVKITLTVKMNGTKKRKGLISCRSSMATTMRRISKESQFSFLLLSVGLSPQDALTACSLLFMCDSQQIIKGKYFTI